MKKLITLLLFLTIGLTNVFSQVEWFTITSFSAKNTGQNWAIPMVSNTPAKLDVDEKTFIIYSPVQQIFKFDKLTVSFNDNCRSYKGCVKDIRNKVGYMTIDINSHAEITIHFKCLEGEMKCIAKFKD